MSRNATTSASSGTNATATVAAANETSDVGTLTESGSDWSLGARTSITTMAASEITV